MMITTWEPPRLVEVQHTGRLIRGPGIFEIEPRGEHSHVRLDRAALPAATAYLGGLGWFLIRPFAVAGVRRSLSGSPRSPHEAPDRFRPPPSAKMAGRDGERAAAVSRRGWVLFLAMSVIWGIPYLLIKVAVEEISPVVVVFARCVVGAAILLPWTIAKGQLRPALRHWRALLLFTVLEMTGPWLLLSYAETKLSSSLTGLLVATRAVRRRAGRAGWPGRTSG